MTVYNECNVYLFIYFILGGIHADFNTVPVISWWVVLWAEETSAYSG